MNQPSRRRAVQVTLTEIDLIAPLFDAYRQFYGQPADIPGARDYLTQRIQNHQAAIFAVVEAGGAVAFALLYPLFSSVSMRPIWILNDLFVTPDARRQGLAGLLLDVALEHARRSGAVRVELSTAVSNTSAQSLYEGRGWTRDTTFLHYDYDLSNTNE